MYHRQIRVEWLYLSLLKELNRLPQMCSPHVDLISTSKISPKITSHWCPIGGIGGAEKLSPCPSAQLEQSGEGEVGLTFLGDPRSLFGKHPQKDCRVFW